MRANGEERLEAIRRELQAILEGGKRITERDLLRLSAQTGIDYSTVVRIQQELSSARGLPRATVPCGGRLRRGPEGRGSASGLEGDSGWRSQRS